MLVKKPSVGIISIGSELLSGRTLNTNASWIGKQLRYQGYHVGKVVVVKDEPEEIREALDFVYRTCSVVITTGGLGPTTDDLTKSTLTHYFGGKLKMHDATYEKLQKWYKNRGRKMNKAMKAQALVPSTAKILENPVGSAPGLFFENEKGLAFVLPGVPQEMKYMVNEYVFPNLGKWITRDKNEFRRILLFGLSESSLAVKMSKWQDRTPDDVQLSYYPKDGMVSLEMTSPEGKEQPLQGFYEFLLKKLKKYVVGSGQGDMAFFLGEFLKENGLSIGVAESCTGGALAQKITSVSGSSQFFKGSLVTYWIEAKENILGIDPGIIQRRTVVSPDTAIAMAEKVREKLNTDIGIGITGTAEVNEKDDVFNEPIIWFGVSDRHRSFSACYSFYQDRNSNIRRACNTAMFLAFKLAVYSTGGKE